MINKFYKNKKVLVTGATGFKGAWLCFWLNMLGSKVYGIGNNPSKKKNLFYNLKLNKKITLKFFDIRNKDKLKIYINSNKIQIIFHLAAQPLVIESYKKPYSTYEINTIGTLNVLETVRQVNTVKSLICVTSYQCYENDLSTKAFKESDRLGGKDPYSASKASAEIIIKSYQESFFKNKKCGIATARVANVIGGGDWAKNRLIPDVIKSIVKNKAISIRNPNFIRPWLHILEPLYGYLILGEKLFNNPKKHSGPWNFGTKKNNVANVLKIVNEIIEFWGKGNIRLEKKQKYFEQKNFKLNINKSKKILRWTPKYSIKKSIQITAEWYKKVLIQKLNAEQITKKQINNYMNESK
jgi:CDP-glucose 4,6-dehydratase